MAYAYLAISLKKGWPEQGNFSIGPSAESGQLRGSVQNTTIVFPKSPAGFFSGPLDPDILTKRSTTLRFGSTNR